MGSDSVYRAIYACPMRQTQALDEWAQIFRAQSPLLERSHALTEVLAHHRLDVSHLLLLHQHKRVRGVFRRESKRKRKSSYGRQKSRNEDDLDATPQHRQVVVHRQFAILDHSISRLPVEPAQSLIPTESGPASN